MNQMSTTMNNPKAGASLRKSTYNGTTPGGANLPLPGEHNAKMIEECGHCGGHNIVDDFEYVPGLGRQKYRKCICSCRDIKMVPAIQTVKTGPVPVMGKTHKEPLEGTMTKDKGKKKCSDPGCDKWGSFMGKCAAGFKEAHGISYADFLRRRKLGDTKEQILANPGKPVTGKSGTANRKTKKPPSATAQMIETAPVPVRGQTALKNIADEHVAVNIDFTDHPALLQKLTTMAKADFRTESQQILYLIAHAGHEMITSETERA
jgi:hypothetical protein